MWWCVVVCRSVDSGRHDDAYQPRGEGLLDNCWDALCLRSLVRGTTPVRTVRTLSRACRAHLDEAVRVSGYCWSVNSNHYKSLLTLYLLYVCIIIVTVARS